MTSDRARVAWCRFEWAEPFRTAHWLKASVDLATEAEAHRRLMLATALHAPIHRLAAEYELKAMLARLAVATMDVAQSKLGPQRRSHGAVERAIAWLQQHLAERDPLDGLAARFGLSPAYFRQRFRAMTGKSPQGFLLDLRMAHARYHLQRSDLLVKEVAAAVGYDDPYFFSRHYRRYFGCAPTDDHRARS